MPQLACISGGGESTSKVACETAVPPSSSSSGSNAVVRAVAKHDDPAESVLLRARDSVGFVELFGAALRRDGSTKGSSNPKAASKLKGVGASRKVPAGKAAVVVAVLPAGKVVAQERRRDWRRPAAGARVFASEAVGAAEPVSPKVSCFGAVRSERRASAPLAEEERGGCWASVTAAVRGLCWSGVPREGEPEASGSSSAVTPESWPPNAVLSPPLPVTGLGDVKRLASRRWTQTMAAGEGQFGLA